MSNINESAIQNVITFLEENEQYGDDWSAEIAELNKIVNDREWSKIGYCFIAFVFAALFLYVLI